MKLLNCLECNSIVSLNSYEGAFCRCKKSKGYYKEDKLTAVYVGPARILGINNSEYRESLTLPKEKYKLVDFNWFVVGENIEKID